MRCIIHFLLFIQFKPVLPSWYRTVNRKWREWQN